MTCVRCVINNTGPLTCLQTYFVPGALCGAFVHGTWLVAVVLAQRRFLDYKSRDLGLPVPARMQTWIDNALISILRVCMPDAEKSNGAALGLSHLVAALSCVTTFALQLYFQGVRFDIIARLMTGSITFCGIIAWLCVRGGVASISERLREQEEEEKLEVLRTLRLDCNRATNLKDIQTAVQHALLRTLPSTCSVCSHASPIPHHAHTKLNCHLNHAY